MNAAGSGYDDRLALSFYRWCMFAMPIPASGS
jgi:hypothetical protein